MKKILAACLFLAALAPALTGCVPAAAVGAGAGALMITDRRHAETYLADEGIEIRAVNRVNEKFGDRVHVNVTSYNRMTLITGEAPDAATRAEIEKIVNGVPGVRSIINELQVAGVSSFAARSNDAYITSKVKARFLDHNKFPATKVKVVTEAGAVHLLGLVTAREAGAAVEIARTTGGVLKVVRLFETISEEQARALDSQPAGGTPPPQK